MTGFLVLLVVLVALGGSVLPVLVQSLGGGSQIRDGMRGLAARYRGFFKPGGLFRPPEVMFRYAQNARVRVRRLKKAARGSRPYLELVIEWGGPDCWLADLEHAGRVTDHGKRLQPLNLRRELAQEFLLRGDPRRAPSLLSDGVVWKLRELRNFGPYQDVEMESERGFFAVRVDGPFLKSSDVPQFVDLALSLFDQVKLSQCREIDFLQEQSTVIHEAKCGVCGAEIVTDMVFCRRCKTPHHADCWQYFGKCTVFGCGEEHFVRPRVASP